MENNAIRRFDTQDLKIVIRANVLNLNHPNIISPLLDFLHGSYTIFAGQLEILFSRLYKNQQKIGVTVVLHPVQRHDQPIHKFVIQNTYFLIPCNLSFHLC